MKRTWQALIMAALLLVTMSLAVTETACAEVAPEITERVKYIVIHEPNISYGAGIEDEQIVIDISADTIALLSKMAWGEARGEDDTRIAATVWCALNRVDAGFENGDLYKVITRPMQFTGYKTSNPVDEHIAEIVTDVLVRWQMEKITGYSHGRVLPSEYLYFASKGNGNVFRTDYKGGTRWDWSIESPYE